MILGDVMLGAIIGDLAGSIYEYDQIKSVKKIKINNIIEDNAFFSDDSILTIAIIDAIISNVSYEEKLKEWGNRYIDFVPDCKPYFKTIFSPDFTKWLKGDYQGTSGGNGAMMRVSAVGYLFDTEEEVIKNAYLATIPSHNDEFSIKCAKTVALIIFYARKGYKKDEIIKKLDLKIKEPTIEKFNYTCRETIDLCLYSIFNANSFKEAIELAISFGGDTDTNACIVASMAEAFYDVDDDLKEKAIEKIPEEFKVLLEKAYSKMKGA